MSDQKYSLPHPGFGTAKKTGYNPDDVDAWIDNAFSLIEQINSDVDDMRAKLARAEMALEEAMTAANNVVAAETAAPSNTSNELDETLRRTLLLAQKTADAAIKEAQEEAAKISSEAHAEAQIITGKANDHARRLAEDAQQTVRADVLKLEAARTELQNDVNKLRSYLESERERVRHTLSAALELLDKGVAESEPPPDVAEVQIPSDPAGKFSNAPQYQGAVVVPDAPPATAPIAASAPKSAKASDSAPPADVPPESAPPSASTASEDEAPSGAAPLWGGPPSSSPSSTEGSASPVGSGKMSVSATSGKGATVTSITGSQPAVDLDDDDKYMEELRRAVSDPSPLGPREDDTTDVADLTGPIPATSSDTQTSEFSADDFYTADDDDDPGFGGRLRRKR